MQLTTAEENYLKAIFKLAEKGAEPVSTNAIAALLSMSAASVTDMLKRLAEKQWIVHEKYKGVTLTGDGNQIATALIRKHRLWEVFLVQKLGFAWDEVHELAEQLEHVHGDALVQRLDAFLGYPRFDPHGDPIPDAEGRWTYRAQILLSELRPGQCGAISGVEDQNPQLLQHLGRLGLTLGKEITLKERIDFDQSMQIILEDQTITLSEKAGQNIYVTIL